MRGKVIRWLNEVKGVRITPAYAGKSLCVRTGSPAFRDHPRVCGEKPLGKVQQWFEPGSPPRMRGKALTNGACVSEVRITPAYAGKSTHHYSEVIVKKDHPRVCGEKLRPQNATCR